MRDAKHTKGPWIIADGLYEVWTSKGPGYGLVCHCAPYCPPHKDSEQGREKAANARLIAAAPDLLNALELAEATIVRLNRHDSANGTLDVIQAAIAKAEGK